MDVSYFSLSEACDIYFKKALGGSEAQRSCRDWGWGACLTSCQQVSPSHDEADRTGPCRAATVSEFPRERDRGRKMHGRDKASRCLAKKLPMDYKTRTTMMQTTNWRGTGEHVNPGILSVMSSPKKRQWNYTYNGPCLCFLDETICQRTDRGSQIFTSLLKHEYPIKICQV